MPCYPKIYRSTTHDTENCRLIDHIHDVIDIGVRQTSVTKNSKEQGEHHDHSYNEGHSLCGGTGRGSGYHGEFRGRGRSGRRSEFPHGTCYTCGSPDHYMHEFPHNVIFSFCRKNRNYEECLDFYENLRKKHK